MPGCILETQLQQHTVFGWGQGKEIKSAVQFNLLISDKPGILGSLSWNNKPASQSYGAAVLAEQTPHQLRLLQMCYNAHYDSAGEKACGVLLASSVSMCAGAGKFCTEQGREGVNGEGEEQQA